MGCGCRKKRSSATARTRNVVKSKPAKARTIAQRKATRAVSNIGKRVGNIRSIAMDAKAGLRCPICKATMKRVSRSGHGDLLQCVNPNCRHISKRK